MIFRQPRNQPLFDGSALYSRILRHHALRIALFFALGIIIAGLLIHFAPNDIGSDYELFRIVSLKALAGEPLYQEITRSDGFVVRYLYLPHVAYMLIPLAVLPFYVGWMILVSLEIVVALLVCSNWHFDLLKTILALTVLPAVFSIFQGNIDGLLLVVLLLPIRWQMFFILAKPQSIGGLGLLSLRYRQSWYVLIIIAVAGLAFGFLDSLLFAQQARGLSANVWHRVSPFQFIIGGVLLLMGMCRRDQRILLLSSPFLSPYVTLGSLWPAWIGFSALINRWVLLVVWALIWIGAGLGGLRLLM